MCRTDGPWVSSCMVAHLLVCHWCWVLDSYQLQTRQAYLTLQKFCEWPAVLFMLMGRPLFEWGGQCFWWAAQSYAACALEAYGSQMAAGASFVPFPFSKSAGFLVGLLMSQMWGPPCQAMWPNTNNRIWWWKPLPVPHLLCPLPVMPSHPTRKMINTAAPVPIGSWCHITTSKCFGPPMGLPWQQVLTLWHLNDASGRPIPPTLTRIRP